MPDLLSFTNVNAKVLRANVSRLCLSVTGPGNGRGGSAQWLPTSLRRRTKRLGRSCSSEGENRKGSNRAARIHYETVTPFP